MFSAVFLSAQDLNHEFYVILFSTSYMEGGVVLVWKYIDKNSLLFVLTLKVNMVSW